MIFVEQYYEAFVAIDYNESIRHKNRSKRDIKCAIDIILMCNISTFCAMIASDNKFKTINILLNR